MINERLTHEELKSLSLAMKSHFEVMAESGSEAEIIECSQIVRALKELNERRHTMDSEPVVFTDERNLHHIAMGRETSLIWGKQNSEAGDVPLYRHAQPAPVVPPMQHWEELCREHPDMSIRDAIIRAAWWNHCRAAMLQAGNSPVIPGWIPVSEKLPEESGRYWCYVEEQTDLGKSHYQWNCSWNGERWWVEGEDGGIVTHWMPLPVAPKESK